MMQASFSFNTTATLCPVYPKNAHHPFLDRAIAPVLASASEASNIGKRLAQWWEISSRLLRLLHQPRFQVGRFGCGSNQLATNTSGAVLHFKHATSLRQCHWRNHNHPSNFVRRWRLASSHLHPRFQDHPSMSATSSTFVHGPAAAYPRWSWVAFSPEFLRSSVP